ncbi:MAG: orotidine-5'-phosphate decarboxylase [Candidatus Eisenbacteria bacterium]|uniref:Orotidine 5'-phosphate decarboxylase n=1 Tax=Eiseniibacteriota bacterium TaxID=2212470 RepID=A0A538U0A5_UNCEI|nr:MAG: orotidine-5'-phosphate decarboxylase [Candidatus Eisenbacteria bacterium]
MTEIAVAYDVASLEDALALDARLGPGPELAKVGLELYTAAGPEAVRSLAGRGRRVFLDLKLHDIPNTVRGAARAASRLGAELLSVHATGGREMIAAAVDGVREGGGATRVIAVTILTSLDPADMPPGFAAPFSIAAVAPRLLALAESAGAAGIVCAAGDLPAIRRAHPEPFYAVTPAIRPSGGAAQDQRRVTTVSEAVRLGSSLMVLGRAISHAPDPAAALVAAREECRVAEAVGASTQRGLPDSSRVP